MYIYLREKLSWHVYVMKMLLGELHVHKNYMFITDHIFMITLMSSEKKAENHKQKNDTWNFDLFSERESLMNYVCWVSQKLNSKFNNLWYSLLYFHHLTSCRLPNVYSDLY